MQISKHFRIGTLFVIFCSSPAFAVNLLAKYRVPDQTENAEKPYFLLDSYSSMNRDSYSQDEINEFADQRCKKGGYTRGVQKAKALPITFQPGDKVVDIIHFAPPFAPISPWKPSIFVFTVLECYDNEAEQECKITRTNQDIVLQYEKMKSELQPVANPVSGYPPPLFNVVSKRYYRYNDFILARQLNRNNEAGPQNGPEIQANSKTEIKNGLLIDPSGQKVQDGSHLFILNKHGIPYLSKAMHHSYVLKSKPGKPSYGIGKDVAFAGYVETKDGKIVSINNFSGHYRPTIDQLYVTVNYLNHQGILSPDVQVEGRQPAQGSSNSYDDPHLQTNDVSIDLKKILSFDVKKILSHY